MNLLLCPGFVGMFHTYVHPIPKMVSVRINALDSYFILRYLIVKYTLSLIKDIIQRLLIELWPLISELVSAQYLKNYWMEFAKLSICIDIDKA